MLCMNYPGFLLFNFVCVIGGWEYGRWLVEALAIRERKQYPELSDFSLFLFFNVMMFLLRFLLVNTQTH